MLDFTVDYTENTFDYTSVIVFPPDLIYRTGKTLTENAQKEEPLC